MKPEQMTDAAAPLRDRWFTYLLAWALMCVLFFLGYIAGKC